MGSLAHLCVFLQGACEWLMVDLKVPEELGGLCWLILELRSGVEEDLCGLFKLNMKSFYTYDSRSYLYYRKKNIFIFTRYQNQIKYIKACKGVLFAYIKEYCLNF